MPRVSAAHGRAGVPARARSAWELLTAINSYIVAREPWKHFKETGADDALSRILWNTLEALRIVWVMMAPFMPASTREALTRLGADPDAHRRRRRSQWGGLPNGCPGARHRPDLSAHRHRRNTSEEPARWKNEANRHPPLAAPAADAPAPAGPPIETTQAAPPDWRRSRSTSSWKIDLRVAEVRAAERVPKSKKLIKMTVFTGDDERTIVAGIGTKYAPEELVGRKVVIVANLQPAKLMGVESNGMVLAASIDGEPSLAQRRPRRAGRNARSLRIPLSFPKT